MSRHAVIKRAKIRRSRRIVAFELLRAAIQEKLMELLLAIRPIDYDIKVQPVSELTEEQRAQRCAPRIDVTFFRREK